MSKEKTTGKYLYKVTIGTSATLIDGYAYVLAHDVTEAAVKGRKEYAWLRDRSRRVVSVEELADKVVI